MIRQQRLLCVTVLASLSTSILAFQSMPSGSTARQRGHRPMAMLADAASGDGEYFLPNPRSFFPGLSFNFGNFLGAATERASEVAKAAAAEIAKRKLAASEAPLISEATSASPIVQAIHNKRLRWYNSAIDRHGREGRVAEALELLQDMITADVEPSDVTLLIVALACINAGRNESAVSVLEIMTERGVKHPGLEIYSSALIEALRAGDRASAAFLVEDVRREIVYPHELRGIELEWRQAGKRRGWGSSSA